MHGWHFLLLPTVINGILTLERTVRTKPMTHKRLQLWESDPQAFQLLPDQVRNLVQHFTGRVLLPDLSVDATDQLDVVRIRNGRSWDELGYRAGRVEALGHLPGVALGLQLAL